MEKSEREPIHPGEALRVSYLEPLNISISELSRRLRVEISVIQELVAEKSRLTVDLAYRLYLYFGINTRYWLNLQRDYDLATCLNKETLKKQIQPYPWEKQEIWDAGVKEIV